MRWGDTSGMEMMQPITWWEGGARGGGGGRTTMASRAGISIVVQFALLHLVKLCYLSLVFVSCYLLANSWVNVDWHKRTGSKVTERCSMDICTLGLLVRTIPAGLSPPVALSLPIWINCWSFQRFIFSIVLLNDSYPDARGIHFNEHLPPPPLQGSGFNSGRIVCLTDGLSNIFFVPRLLEVWKCTQIRILPGFFFLMKVLCSSMNSIPAGLSAPLTDYPIFLSLDCWTFENVLKSGFFRDSFSWWASCVRPWIQFRPDCFPRWQFVPFTGVEELLTGCREGGLLISLMIPSAWNWLIRIRSQSGW